MNQINEISSAPNGASFSLPQAGDYAKEFERLKKIIAKERKSGREIVVVMGLGVVGSVMAGVIADSVDKKTMKSKYFVIGIQRPSTRSYWKIPYLNRGISPVEAEDPEVAPMIDRDRKSVV